MACRVLRGGQALSRPALLAPGRRLLCVASSSEKQKRRPLLSDERITAEPGYNRWLQLVPACVAGTALGTYFAVPGVLGPHICRATGVVASVSSDFSLGEVVPLAATMSLVAGVLAAGLANYSATFGVRRVALAGSVLFPVGIYALPALALQSHSLAAFSAATVGVGGVGFYCIYPQLPPFITTRWFPDRKGTAVSIYFCAFGSGMIVASKAMQAMLAHFRTPPTRLGGLAEVPLSLGPAGERLARAAPGEGEGGLAHPLTGTLAGGGGEGASRAAECVEVVLATPRDLVASGFGGLEEGVYLVGSGSNGVVETMGGMAVLTFCLLHVSAWSYRLPHPADLARRARAAEAVGGAGGTAAERGAERGAGGEDEAARKGGALPGCTLSEAHGTPHLYLLWASTGALGITGLPFLLSGQFMVNDVFGGAALPASVIAATAVAFPGMVGGANMGGRLVWGPVSDRLGRGATFGAFGLLSVPALLSLPLATSMVHAEPETALALFKAASLTAVAVFAGGPVLLAPAVVDVFGARDATAIYGRLWMMLPAANFFGATLVSRVREYSYSKHALAIAETCDEAAFTATFGAPPTEAQSLIASKTATLPLLLTIAPEGTVDPSPLLYDDAFYTLAGFSALACVCNLAAYRLPRPLGRSRARLTRSDPG